MSDTAVQRSFDDLGTPLHDVTFCVLDLETTGGSPAACEITEVGAARFKGGECLGTLQTLVNPGCPIPPGITVLTGITEAMVIPAPPIDEVLPSLLEFIGDAVIVGHNVRFDLGFLRAALERSGRPALANRFVDTCALARRLVRDEVPNCQLGTLASRFRLDHRPNHRALDDTLATADLLHLLLERAGTLGVTGLDDLLGLPKMGGHPQAGKLKLTSDLPRSAGVYLFRDRHGRVLYVGKAANLRARVRSYFSSDSRRKVGNLLREAVTVDHEPCAHGLEAAVRELRLIHAHEPHYNKQGTTWRRYCWVKLTLDEPFPRLAVARVARADGNLYLGPLGSQRQAQRVIEAIHTAVPIRRCTRRLGRAAGAVVGPCAAAQLGVAMCPCSGEVDARTYDTAVQSVVEGLTSRPDLLLTPLEDRLRALAREQRYEEAATTRDRADALVAALRRQRWFDGLRRADHLVVELRGGGGAELEQGVLRRAWAPGHQASLFAGPDVVPPPVDHPLPKELADELWCVASWFEQRADQLRVVSCDGALGLPLPALPSFQPRAA